MAAPKVGAHAYEFGNLHRPVLVLGEDPSTEGNVLISRLEGAVSVPADSISTEEGTPTTEEEEGKESEEEEKANAED